MKKLRFVPALVILASCTDSSTIEDLGTLPSGKADVAAIEVPIRLAPAESVEYSVTVDGPFELVTRYAPTGELELIASADGATSELTGDQPALRVDASREVKTTYTLALANRSDAEIAGTLGIRNADPGCSDGVWTGWFETLVGKLDSTSSVIDDQERALLDAIVAGRPCVATSTPAYAIWHQRFVIELANANSVIDDHESARIGYVLAALPRSTGDAAYLTWAQHFLTSFAGVGTMVDADERKRLETELAGKPCAAGPEALAAWNRLAAGPVPDAAILTAAHPVCN